MAASLATSAVADAGDAAGAAGLLSVVVARETPADQHTSAYVSIRQHTSAYLLSVVVARETPADLACLTVADSCIFFLHFFL